MHQAKSRQEREVATRNTKSPKIDVATKEDLLKQKEYSRKNLRSRHQLEVATPNEDDAGRNINLRSRC